jgi:N-acetylglucosaminyl-diphospho-decaprenol L-rhamnosyltransferase
MGKYTAAIILNHNDNEDTLRVASAFNAMPFIDRVAVVDNSSAAGLDGSEAELSAPKDIFLKIRNNGYASGNNEAIRELEKKFGLPDLIIISNPDVDISPASIQSCIDFLNSHVEFAVASPHMLKPSGERHHLAGWRERTMLCDLAYSSGLLSRSIGMYRETYSSDYWSTPYSVVDCVTGSFFVIKGSAFKETGFFDEHTFLFYEEDILGFKLKRHGLKEAVMNDCTFIHREGVSAGKSIKYIKKYLAMQRSRIYFQREFKKAPFYKMIALYAATGLGLAENLIKTAVHSTRRSQNDKSD